MRRIHFGPPKSPNRIGIKSLPGPHALEAARVLRRMAADLPPAGPVPGWMAAPASADEVEAWCQREMESRERLSRTLLHAVLGAAFPATLDPTDIHILSTRIGAALESLEGAARMIDPRIEAPAVALHFLGEAWEKQHLPRQRRMLHYRILPSASRSTPPPGG
jgi:hypothetical protein